MRLYFHLHGYKVVRNYLHGRRTKDYLFYIFTNYNETTAMRMTKYSQLLKKL